MDYYKLLVLQALLLKLPVFRLTWFTTCSSSLIIFKQLVWHINKLTDNSLSVYFVTKLKHQISTFNLYYQPKRFDLLYQAKPF